MLQAEENGIEIRHLASMTGDTGNGSAKSDWVRVYSGA